MSLGSASNFFLGAASAGGGAAGPIKSVRFNREDTAYLNKTFSSDGNRKKFTFSFWVKRTNVGASEAVVLVEARVTGTPSADSDAFSFRFDTSDRIRVADWGNFYVTSTARFRDPSAWYHLVLSVDTTQASNNISVYVNGVLDKQGTYPQNTDTRVSAGTGTVHEIGTRTYGYPSDNYYLDAYLADFYFIDGQALDPTSFGAFDDNGVWQVSSFSGSFGTNGFHLFDFANESGIGDDSSGNDNDFTVNNIEGPGNGTSYRTLELSENDPSGSVAQKDKAFDATYIATYVNTSTWAVTNTAWIGAYSSARAELRWIPTGGYEVSSSLRVYYGCYDNTTKTTTLTITYTDTSTETDTMTSGSNNWMKLYTASSAAGKTIQKIELSVSTPSATNTQFGGFVIDDAIVESLNVDTDILFDVPTNGDSSSGTGAGGEVSGNYATLNSNHIHSAGTPTLSQGNLRLNNGTGNSWNSCPSTIVLTSGKWLCELTVETPGTYPSFGVSNPQRVYPDSYLGQTEDSWT